MRVSEVCADTLFLVAEALDVPGAAIAEVGAQLGALPLVVLGTILCPGWIFGRLAWRLFPEACSR